MPLQWVSPVPPLADTAETRAAQRKRGEPLCVLRSTDPHSAAEEATLAAESSAEGFASH